MSEVSRYDTMDRIIQNIIAPITKQEFTYRGKTFSMSSIRVSPSIFRSLVCPEGCGGCCWRSVTLDWLPSENYHPLAKEREIIVNEKSFKLMSIISEDPLKPCQFLNEVGRCNIYEQRPFLCDFSFLRIIQRQNSHNTLMNSTPARGFTVMRVDGKRGNLCTMTDYDSETHSHRIYQFEQLKKIIDYFELETHIDTILEYVKTGPHEMPLDLFLPKAAALNELF